MPRLSSSHHISYLASGLRVVPDGEGKEGIRFFDPVNFVKFVRLLVRNMNGSSAFLTGEAMDASVFSSRRRTV